ncbi:MAG: aldo/keto reductase [Spirochaetia bacterium]|nr:aldo/keto reductase [Spirochaetia bacterium]
MLASFAILCANAQTVKLNSGYEMPVVGLGTWTLHGETAENAVYSAVKSGYRLIDTAKYYGNEAEVGNALKKAVADGICKREDVFITTKLVPWSNSPDSDIDDSLKKLGVSYIDLVLLHQHGSNDDAVYSAMCRAVKAGKVRSIGISNFYTEQSVSHFIKNFDIPPAVVQNENHIFYQNNTLREWASGQGIHIESWYPFGGRGHVKEHLQNPTVLAIAKAHGKSAAQVIVRWHVQAGYITVPGSSNPDHIAENIDIWDFELSENEMQQLKKLDKGARYENW